MSTSGALLIIFSPSCEATHPPIAIFRFGFLFDFPPSAYLMENSLLRFFLIEQVFRIIRSASCSEVVISKFFIDQQL